MSETIYDQADREWRRDWLDQRALGEHLPKPSEYDAEEDR